MGTDISHAHGKDSLREPSTNRIVWPPGMFRLNPQAHTLSPAAQTLSPVAQTRPILALPRLCCPRRLLALVRCVWFSAFRRKVNPLPFPV